MANRYWIGGSGTWDNSSTTNWSSTSGGTGGASAPTNADTAIFDTASAGANYTVTVAATAVSLDTTVANPTGGVVDLSLSGSPTLCTSSGTLTLTSGTITLNNNTLTIGRFSSSNTNTRTIAFGTGKISLTGNNATIWSGATLTNFSHTGTPSVEATYSGSTGTRTINHGSTTGGTESNAVSISITAGSDAVTLAGAFKNIVLTGSSVIFNNSTRTIYGNLTVSSTTNTASSVGSLVTTFGATSGTQDITSNGRILGFPITIDGVGGTVRLQDALTVGYGTFTLTLTNGTFNANNYSVSTYSFDSNNSNTRTLTMGSGTFATQRWDLTTTTNLTFNKDTSTISITGAGSTTLTTFAGGGLTYNNVIFSLNQSSTAIITGSNTFASFCSNTAITLKFTAGTTNTASAWLFSSLYAKQTIGSTSTSSFTLTKSGSGKVLIGNASISYATVTPSNTWYASNSTDGGNNTGITFSGFALYWIGGSGTWNNTNTTNWSESSGGTAAASVPVLGSPAYFDSNSDSGSSFTVTIGDGSQIFLGVGDFIVSGLDKHMTLAGTNHVLGLTGNLSFPATNFTNSLSGGSFEFFSNTTQTITSNGNSFGDYIIPSHETGGSTVLQDALTTTSPVLLVSGTFDANNFNVTADSFEYSSGEVSTLKMGSGTWTLTGSFAVWYLGNVSNFTFNKGTSKIVLTNTSTNYREFYGANLTYNELVIGGSTGISEFYMIGSNTFSKISSTKTVAHSIYFDAGTTTTVANWAVTGTAGNVVTIGSSTAASHTLTKTGGGTIFNVDYLNISYSSATPANTWYAGANSTNSGNNTGWIFTKAPTSGNFFLVFN